MRRGTNRQEYGRAELLAVLDAGMVAHVGVSTPDGPIVLPMAYSRTDTDILLHGAAANALLRGGAGEDICVTVTIVDGLVIARTPFHNSMNYRSVVIRGAATKVEGEEKVEALRLMTDHVVANWDTGRPSSEVDFKKTLVIKVPLDEISGKIRADDAIDDEIDMDGPHWAGVVPIIATWAEPVSAADLKAGIEVPPAIAALAGTPVQ